MNEFFKLYTAMAVNQTHHKFLLSAVPLLPSFIHNSHYTSITITHYTSITINSGLFRPSTFSTYNISIHIHIHIHPPAHSLPAHRQT